MRMHARQRRALDAIESALEARDPAMTAMFAMFARLTRGEEPTGAERLPRSRDNRWRKVWSPLIPAAAMLAVLAGMVIAVLTGGGAGCGTRSSTLVWHPTDSCAARPSPPSVQKLPSRVSIVFPSMPK